MFKSRAFLAVSLATIACLSTTALAQTKPKTNGQGSKPKITGQGTTKPTLGTVQLPGDNGKLKTTYQLGEKGNELHFTLDSASVALRYPAPEDIFLAKKAERLLVLNFTVHNPLNKEMSLGSKSFAFTVVSPDDANFEFKGNILQSGKKTRVTQALKPAQKVKCVVVIPIHEAGPVNKVMVQRGNAPILRYDLTGKVDPMVSVFSKDGVDASEKGVGAEVGKPFDMGAFDITVKSARLTDEQIKGYAPSADQIYVVLTVEFANKQQLPASVGFQFFTPELRDAGGATHSWNHDILGALSDATLAQSVDPDNSVTGRYYFHIPKTAAVGTMKLKFIDSASLRYVTLDISL